MHRILIIEDDSVLRAELQLLLINNGYEAEYITDFKNVAEAIQGYHPDLILLDINLPITSGKVILQNLRKNSEIPVIILTSSTSKLDEALSLSYGADNYITKPYSPTLLILKINAILKRSDTSQNQYNYHNIRILLDQSLLQKDEHKVGLTKNESIILNRLLASRGKIVPREEIMTLLWNHASYINENALTVSISRLRNKFSELGCADAIETYKGQGYLLR